MTKQYSEEYDAYFDAQENKWLEKICGSKECDYCKDRPKKPIFLIGAEE